VKDILLLESGADSRWSGKTGSCAGVAWHVGFVERNGKTSFYALNLGGGEFSQLAQQRNLLVRKLLEDANLLRARH
jgi:beta-lactamase class D